MKQNEFLGVKETVSYYVSNLVGAGILVVPAIAYSMAGEMVLLVWIALIATSWPLAKIFATISVQYPHNSGILNFLHLKAPKSISQFIDDITIFVMLVGNPILGFVAARYLISALGLDYEVFFYPLAFLFMVLSVIFNLMGLRNSSRFQSILTFVTLIVLLALAGFAFWTNFDRVGQMVNPPSFSKNFDFLTMLQTFGICFFVFVGWENVAAIAPNVKDRDRTFNRAILIAVPIVGVCYMFIAVALAISIPADAVGTNFAVLDLLSVGSSNAIIPKLVSLFSVFVVVVSCNAWVLAAGKVINGLSTEGRLPRFLSKGSEETPHMALLFLVVFYGVVVFASYLFGNQEDLIIRYVSAGFIIIYLFTLWYFYQMETDVLKRFLAMIGLILTGIAASGVITESFALLILGVVLLAIRQLGSAHGAR